MNIQKLVFNAIKTFRALSLPMKIVVSVVGVAIILSAVSRVIEYRFQKKIQENTTPHKQTVDLTKVPSEVKSFLSEENLQKLDDNGMNIYTGTNPPNIEGTYAFKNQVVKYDPVGYFFNVISLDYTFRDQKDNNTVTYIVKGREEKEFSEKGNGVIISGEGNCFSVYVDNSTNAGGECKSKSAEVFSACKTDKGLVDMDQGTLWTYVSDKCTSEEHVPAGYLRIFTQKTLAPKVN